MPQRMEPIRFYALLIINGFCSPFDSQPTFRLPNELNEVRPPHSPTARRYKKHAEVAPARDVPLTIVWRCCGPQGSARCLQSR
jgi:hypothetical protein